MTLMFRWGPRELSARAFAAAEVETMWAFTPNDPTRPGDTSWAAVYPLTEGFRLTVEQPVGVAPPQPAQDIALGADFGRASNMRRTPSTRTVRFRVVQRGTRPTTRNDTLAEFAQALALAMQPFTSHSDPWYLIGPWGTTMPGQGSYGVEHGPEAKAVVTGVSAPVWVHTGRDIPGALNQGRREAYFDVTFQALGPWLYAAQRIGTYTISATSGGLSLSQGLAIPNAMGGPVFPIWTVWSTAATLSKAVTSCQFTATSKPAVGGPVRVHTFTPGTSPGLSYPYLDSIIVDYAAMTYTEAWADAGQTTVQQRRVWPASTRFERLMWDAETPINQSGSGGSSLGLNVQVTSGSTWEIDCDIRQAAVMW